MFSFDENRQCRTSTGNVSNGKRTAEFRADRFTNSAVLLLPQERCLHIPFRAMRSHRRSLRPPKYFGMAGPGKLFPRRGVIRPPISPPLSESECENPTACVFSSADGSAPVKFPLDVCIWFSFSCCAFLSCAECLVFLEFSAHRDALAPTPSVQIPCFLPSFQENIPFRVWTFSCCVSHCLSLCGCLLVCLCVSLYVGMDECMNECMNECVTVSVCACL